MQTCFYQNGVWFTTSSVWLVEYKIITENENKKTILNYFSKGPWAVEGE